MAGVKGMRRGKVEMQDRTLIRIQTSRIVNRLEEHIFGSIKMEPSAVTAALGLLKKKLPDLGTTTLQGDEKNPVVFKEMKRLIIDPNPRDQDS